MHEEIVRGVYQVGGSGFSGGSDAAVYLVAGAGAAALIDAGTGEGRSPSRIVENIRSAGVGRETVKYLILTHCHVDHVGGAPALSAELGCKVVAHRLGAEILKSGDDPRTAASWYGMKLAPIAVDLAFDAESMELELGGDRLHLVHVPGHSPDSIAVWLDRDGRRVLFGQDVHGPIHPALASDPILYRKSLQTLLGLKADVLCEGHSGVFESAGEVEKFIRSFL